MGAEKILVLDVDETLLNMEPLFFLKKFKKNYKEYEGKLIFDGYYLSPRPNLKEFIKKAKEHFKLAAFSVIERSITMQKLDAAGILDDFIKIYGKEDLKDGKKTLKAVERDFGVKQEDIIIIDDIPSLVLEQERAFKIEPWFIGGSKEDSKLLEIFDNVLEHHIKVFS